MLRIKLIKSTIGHTAHNRSIVKALGIRKMHQTVEHEDNPSIRGMVHKVKHLLQVEVAEGSPKAKSAPKPPAASKAQVKAQAAPASKPMAPKAKPAAAKATKPAPAKKPAAKAAKAKE